GEVDLLDAIALGTLPEGGLGALRGAAEEDALVGFHGGSSGAALSPIRLVASNGRRGGASIVPLAERLVDGTVAQRGGRQVARERGNGLRQEQLAVMRQLDDQDQAGERRAHRGAEDADHTCGRQRRTEGTAADVPRD